MTRWRHASHCSICSTGPPRAAVRQSRIASKAFVDGDQVRKTSATSSHKQLKTSEKSLYGCYPLAPKELAQNGVRRETLPARGGIASIHARNSCGTYWRWTLILLSSFRACARS
jgi:hypothetical protein